MGLAGSVNAAVIQAKTALGDLVKPATLRNVIGRTYDQSQGSYTDSTEDHSVEVAPDKFSYSEQQSGFFQQTDVKLIMFNTNNDLNPNTQSQLLMDGLTFNVVKADPTLVGNFKPIWSLVLRKAG